MNISNKGSNKRRYIQRDLEDQITEELQNKTQNSFNNEYLNQIQNQFLKTTSMSTAQTLPVMQVKVSEVLALLAEGYARYTKSEKEAGKSIQTKFNLTASQVNKVFQNNKLKGRKTREVTLEVIDDAPEVKPTNFKPRGPKAEVAAKTAGPATPVASAQPDALFS